VSNSRIEIRGGAALCPGVWARRHIAPVQTQPDQPERAEASSPDADPEPRWPALIAILTAGGIYAALPGSLAVGPRWLLPSVAVVLGLAGLATHRVGYRRTNIIIGYLVSTVLTAFLLWSTVRLVRALPSHREPPVLLLRSAASLWTTNVLVFALWYWRLDAGGPHAREARTEGHTAGAFLFPQMTITGPASRDPDGSPWSPEFIDYLFLAFNTCTAFSPTDVPILSRWAKLLVMVQAVMSLAVISVLIGRAVNVL
jgi:hypothetical protein